MTAPSHWRRGRAAVSRISVVGYQGGGGAQAAGRVGGRRHPASSTLTPTLTPTLAPTRPPTHTHPSSLRLFAGGFREVHGAVGPQHAGWCDDTCAVARHAHAQPGEGRKLLIAL